MSCMNHDECSAHGMAVGRLGVVVLQSSGGIADTHRR